MAIYITLSHNKKQIDQKVMNPSRTQIIYEVLGNWVSTWNLIPFNVLICVNAARLCFANFSRRHSLDTHFWIRLRPKRKQVDADQDAAPLLFLLRVAFIQKAADAANEICICAAWRESDNTCWSWLLVGWFLRGFCAESRLNFPS